MDKLIITGGKKLSGDIEVSGAKNAILPIMAATLLTDGISKLKNVPFLNDIKMMAHLLRITGARVQHNSNREMIIDTRDICFFEAPYELVSKMRASVYVLGPLLARFKQAKVSFPGGCAIGARPVDLHIAAMKKLGAEIELKKGYINASAPSGLKGNNVFFEKSSVGATCNALNAAALAEGKTIIQNAATEPEIDSLIDFLIACGASISGKGTKTIEITGVKKLKPAAMRMMPDRIEAGTFLIAGAVTKSELCVKNCIPEHLSSLTEKLKECGYNLETGKDFIKIKSDKPGKAASIKTLPYPGFPTDLQAQFMALMSVSEGDSVIEETIFPDRFMHVAELNRLDADITTDRNIAVVKGVKKLSGAEVMATDLRASAALVIAGLAAEGQTVISRIYHIDRGYEKIEKKLSSAGADIKRING
ncbi:MAG: UDP-N-acetylglucosamine 1-carboxyvinyltransferase [Candidatus Cloacimonadota bacterium]|nr:MAG: UDP-N-acetylglucosamine 1-carboxyvinyltransferase [Candidatus Cloacimonadota bacterium]